MSIRYLSGINVDNNVLFVDDANNRVGIGTGSPNQTLEVKGADSSTVQAIFQATDSQAAYRGGIQLGNASGNQNSQIYHNSSGDNTLTFVSNYSAGTGNKFIFAPGGTETVRFLQNGNVGIGTTNPSYRLDVDAVSATSVARFYNSSNTATQVEIGDSGNSQYSDLILHSNSGTAEIFKAGTGYSSYGGALALNIYNSSGAIAFHPNGIANAMFINTSGNVGIGTTAPGAKLQVSGTIATNSSLSDVDAYRIIKPNGGALSTSTPSATGAIRITYPVGFTNTMHRVKVNIYEYTTNESFTIYFGGYNYSPDSLWYNEFAYVVNNPGTDRNFTVRFGYNGTKMVVYIGELASTWAYPQVFIEEVELGYGGQSNAWRDDAWAIGFEATAFQNVSKTVSNPQATNWARNGSSTYYSLGNVGIGTTAPSGARTVIKTPGVNDANEIALQLNHGDGGLIANQEVQLGFGQGDGTTSLAQIGAAYEGSSFNGSLIFRTNGASLAERMRITSAGNVGIGTTSPGAKLEVFDGDISVTTGGTFSFLNLNRNFIPNSSGVLLGGTKFRGYSTGTTYQSGVHVYGYSTEAWTSTSSPGYLSIQTTPSGSTTPVERMVVTSAGNVGIGTTSPAYKLDVNVASNSDALRVQQAGASRFILNGDGVMTWGVSAANGVLTWDTNIAYIGGLTNNALGIWAGGSEKVRITTGGNVGIGTTSPSKKLHIYESGAKDAELLITSTYADGYDAQITLENTYTGGRIYELLSTNDSRGTIGGGKFAINDKTAGDSAARLVIDSSGNVGIGTTAPTAGYKLDVVGSILSQVASGNTSIVVSTNNANGAMNAIAGSGLEIATDGTNQNIAFRTGVSTRMYITSAGNVGIGTTSPSALLHVATASTTGTTSMLLLSRASGYGHTLFEQIYDSTYFTAGKTLTLKNDAGTAFAHFAGNNTGTRTDLLIPTGNVGIGTNAPITELEILSSAYDGITMSRTAQSGGTYIQGRSHDTSNVLRTAGRIVFGATAAANAADGFITFNTYSADTENERMRVTATGNVGIGTTAPNAKLNVNTNAMGVTVSDSSGISLTNGTAAAAGAQQMSPTLRWSGQGWATTPLASRNVSFISFLTPQQGTTNPSGILNFASSINGGAYSSVMSLTTGGALIITAGFSATSGTFTSTINNTISGLATTPTDGIVTVNGTAATAGVPVQISPRLRISGTAWNTGGTPASNTMNWTIDNLSTSGNPPTSALRFNFDRNAGGYSTLVSFISNGNVGIGTTSPTEKLHVVGNVLITGTLEVDTVNNGSGDFLTRTSGGIVTRRTAAEVRSDIQASQYFTVSSSSWIPASTSGWFRLASTSGNQRGSVRVILSFVGGNFTPQNYIIDVTKDWSTTASLRVDVRTAQSQYISGVRVIQDTVNTSIYHLEANFASSLNPYQFDLSFDNAYGFNSTWTMATTAPLVASTNGTVILSKDIFLSGNYSTDLINTGNINISGNTLSSINTNGNIILSPNGSGNVGIGTTSPGKKLVIAGASSELQFDSDSDVSTIASRSLGGASNKWLLINPAGGNVGIGTASPSQKLTVSGSTGDILGITNGTTTGYGYVDNNGFGLFTSSGAGGTGIYYRTANIIDHYVNGSIAMRLNSTGNVGINNTAPTARLDIVGDSAVFKVSSVTADTSLPTKRLAEFAGIYNSGANGHQMFISSTSGLGSWEINQTKTWGGIMTFGVSTNSTEITRHLAIDSSGNVGIGNTAPTQALHVTGNARVTGAYYDSSNSAGSSGQVLSSTGSGTAWVNQGEATATSLYDLLPAARVAFNWTGQVVNDTWTTVFSKSSNLLTTGTWMVKMYVSDFATGGGHYTYTYSGMFTWYQDTTNQAGEQAASEIYLHRMGHAANASVLYLRTTETAAASSGDGLFQIKGNYSNTSNQTISFQFVKIF